MIIYKEEKRSEPKEKEELDELGIPGKEILKLCLFKMDENMRGEKFGEQLLKKAIDYAYRNKYDTTYLTVFPKHEILVRLISRFGFIKANSKGEEDVYFKYTKVISTNPPITNFEFHKKFWPCVKYSEVDKFVIPIIPKFHDRLFPEISHIYNKQLSFFEDKEPKTPGNAIRKVYICNAQINSINSGDILLFYRSGDSIITTIGVLQDYSTAENIDDIRQLVGSRSVYSEKELLERIEQKSSAKIVNFYYAENFSASIKLETLLEIKALNGTPQSITKIGNDGFNKILDLLDDNSKGIFYE